MAFLPRTLVIGSNCYRKIKSHAVGIRTPCLQKAGKTVCPLDYRGGSEKIALQIDEVCRILPKVLLVYKAFSGFALFIFQSPLKPYQEVEDLEGLQERMTQCLGDYNARSRKPMDLVMFTFAVEHISRLAR